MHNKILKEILSNREQNKAKILTRFFKTGKGEYGEGDKFLGITVPVSRRIANEYKNISFQDILKLLKNKYHEVRLVAILILVQKYKILNREQNLKGKKELVEFYLNNTKSINNWDLVDLSAHYILGDYLFDKKSKRKILDKLAKSNNIWERRIAIISTFAFIYKGESLYTFKIVNMLIEDQEDLIHKACGWMLREVGKRVSEQDLISYLDKNLRKMPRTMLRYAIEKFSEEKRLYYLKKIML